MKTTITAFLAACSLVGAVAATKDYSSYVNPFIGTGGHGHTFPGATMPHGMIQPSPDTRINGWDACSGYFWTDTIVNGFTQNHLSGTGCADYGDFLIMPTVGAQQLDPQIDTLENRPFASAFDKATEKAEPGYYSSFLKRYGVKAEVTAADRAAIYRFTFPESHDAGFVVDIDYSIQNQRNTAMQVEAVGDNAIAAYKMTRYWAFDQQLYMYAEFSKPFRYELFTDTLTDSRGNSMPRCKALLKFPDTKAGEQVLVKVGISAVDGAGARNNLAEGIPGWDFDKVRADARARWNDCLGKIEITADNDSDRNIFYTALYHANIAPNLFQDADGRYLGMDRKIHKNDSGHPVYTVFSLWDTHRALHPLYTIIDPEANKDYMRSLLLKHKEGGLLPKWELAGNYTATMPGYHAVSVLADAIAKDQYDFDIDEALQAALKVSRYDSTGIVTPRAVREALVQKSKLYKDSLGYIPWNEEFESVAKGLEYAYDDWCIARIAEVAGDKAATEEFDRKGQNYRNYFDPATKFMRGRDREGRWHEPFSPFSSNHREDDYCEGTAWQWNWFVPHDVEGLIGLIGGKEAFAARLDSLFSADSSLEGKLVSADISGLIGQYAHGNEPSHHIIHLYNYADRPDRTQELVDQVLKEQYRNAPDGLSGNEDCGQMSAWYVLNSLGFYQVCPGKPVYSIGRPYWPHAEVNLPGGKKFVVDVKGYGKDRPYIRSMKLNGKTLEAPFFTHDQLAAGGVLEVEMSDTPQR